jgi:carboxymethylenebutenolidase
MGEKIELKAADGAVIGAYVARPAGSPKGGVVVIQEIFGVNAHIRSVADRFAAAGYLAVAPAVFDRVEKDVEIGYEPADMTHGMAIAGKLDRQAAAEDVAAAVQYAKSAGRVGIVGFCLGGTFAWVAAARTPDVSAAVGYYGGGILGLKDLQPVAPVMLHFGEKDGHIPVAGVQELEALHPEVPVYLYPAGHAFNRDGNAAYDAPSAQLAWGRTMDFFGKYLG